MNMLELFKRTKKVKEEAFVAPEMKVSVLILSLMNTYLEQCKNDVVLVREEPDLEREYKRLEELGLKNSENAKLLKAKMEEIQAKKDKSRFGKEVVDYVQRMKQYFPNSYLVSFDQFKHILKDYHLITNFLRNYSGIIPSSNITEIESVMKVFKDCDYKMGCLLLGKFGKDDRYTYKNFHYVKGVEVRRENERKDGERIRARVEEIGNIIGISYDSSYGRSSIGINRVEEITKAFPDGLKSGPFDDFNLNLEKINHNELMIAAPRGCFSSEFKISQMPVDPIVFQCCPYGVVVHSVWGEEADNKVLEEYKTLNQKILEA